MSEAKKIRITVNHEEIYAVKGQNLLELLLEHGYQVPYLCYHPGLSSYGSCRLCTVEINEGKGNQLVASCTYPVRNEALEVYPETFEVIKFRKTLLKLLLLRSPTVKKIQDLARRYEVQPEEILLKNDGAAEEEAELCILCGLCVRACNQALKRNAISFVHRGVNRKVSSPLEEPPETCIACGACSYVCPTGAVQAQSKEGFKHIQPWNAKRELLKCSECGQNYVPKETAKEVSKYLEASFNLQEEESPFQEKSQLCEQCKRKQTLREYRNTKIPY